MTPEIVRITAPSIIDYIDQLLVLQAHLHEWDELPAADVEVYRKRLIKTAQHGDNYFVGLFWRENVVAMGVVGWMPPHPEASEAYVNNIVTHKNHRSQGYGRMIMEALCEQAKKWGCDRVRFTSSKPGAQEMYRRLEFRVHETTVFVKDCAEL